MVLIVPNPDARGNVQNGRRAFAAGLRDPESVFRAHLRWNRGTSANYHFWAGYREAAKEAGEQLGDSLLYLGIGANELSATDNARKEELRLEARAEKYGPNET